MATLETTRMAEFLNQRVFLVSNSDTNKQLGARPDGTVYTNSNLLAWETWTVQDAGNGEVFLVSTHNTQLGSKADGSVYTNSNRLAWERWRIEHAEGGRFLFTSVAHGLHLGARPDGSVYTHTNRLGWEQWSVIKNEIIQYIVTIRTGDKMWAGTDANVYITLHGDRGSTGEQYLDSPANDFERDSERNYVFNGIDIGTPEKISLRHDNTGAGAAWYVDWVKVDKENGKKSLFPCYSWLDAGGQGGIDRQFSLDGGIPAASIIDGKIITVPAGSEIQIYDHRNSTISEEHEFTFTQSYTQTISFDQTESTKIGAEFGVEVSVPIKAVQLGADARLSIEKVIESKFGLSETKSSEAEHVYRFIVPGNTLYIAQIHWSQRVQYGHIKRGDRYLPFRAALGLKQDVQSRTFLKGDPLPQDVIDKMKTLGLVP
jgi:hypothetical protein